MLPSIPELDQATFDHPAAAMSAGSFSNIPLKSNSSTHRSVKKLRNNNVDISHTQIIFRPIEEEPPAPLVLAKNNEKPPSLLQYMPVDSNDDNDELMQLHLSMPPTDNESYAQSRRSTSMPSFRNLSSSSFDDTITNRKYAPPSPWYAAPHESYFLGNVVGVKS